MADAPAYVSRVRIERLGGPQRLAYLPAEEEPVAFGVHSEVAEHYGVSPEQYPPHATTLDYVVAAAGGWLAGTFAGALEARQIEVDPERYEAEAIGEVMVEDHVLVIRRITVRYRLAVPEDRRAEAERVHGFHARFCPVARSLEGGIDVRTELEFVWGQGRQMPTVREATFDLFRAHGMTTMFGNPGSTELPMLAEFPDDFSYVLGLQELVVVGMADGYAQASGRTTHVNLHTAPGVGNAAGGIFNAQGNRAPLVITAGQQVRAQVAMEATLTNRDATVGPRPHVKWSNEPLRPQDVPGAIARAIHHASLPPKGPAFVSIPMDDWAVEADEDLARNALARSVSGRAAPDPALLEDLARRLEQARNPVLVAGPDIDASGGWDAAVALAERQRLPVWAAPSPSGSRLGFPESHPYFMGALPPAIGPLSETLKPYDLALVVGSSVFPYYPYVPGPLLPDGLALVAFTSDPAEAARAPMGDAIVADVALALAGLVERVGEANRPVPEPRPEPGEPPHADPMSGSEAMAALADVWPEDGIAVVETPSSTVAARNRLRLSKPGSYYQCASGGLGFGISAAVGVQLAQPSRPVICVLGEGSAQYGITALWTAVAYKVPVTFLVLRNEEYMILKWFSAFEQIEGVPGLDLPGLDVAAVARGYGMQARDVTGRDELHDALRDAIAVDDGPRVVQAPVASGMWME